MIDEGETTSIAMEVLKYSKEQHELSQKNQMLMNRRLFIILLIVIILWFATIGISIYYNTHYGTEVTTEEVETNDGGNACIGDKF